MRQSFVVQRWTTSDAVTRCARDHGLNGQDGPEADIPSIQSIPSIYAAPAANAALVLIGVTTALLDRQIQALAARFEQEGGFTERLYRVLKATAEFK